MDGAISRDFCTFVTLFLYNSVCCMNTFSDRLYSFPKAKLPVSSTAHLLVTIHNYVAILVAKSLDGLLSMLSFISARVGELFFKCSRHKTNQRNILGIVKQAYKMSSFFFSRRRKKNIRIKVLPARAFAFYNRSHEMVFQQTYYIDEEKIITSLITN